MEEEWGPSSKESTEFRGLCNSALNRSEGDKNSLWNGAPNREWRKLICYLAENVETDQRFQHTKFAKDKNLLDICNTMAELFQLLYSSDYNSTKRTKVLNLLNLIVKGFKLGKMIFKRFNKMNVYLHDVMVHTSVQYALYGSFRSTSCEHDEALFSDMKDIIRNSTNHHDELLKTILLRLAAIHRQQLEYGYKKDYSSRISKIFEKHQYKNCTIEKDIIGEDQDALLEFLSRFGFGNHWFKESESSFEFFSVHQPETLSSMFLKNPIV